MAITDTYKLLSDEELVAFDSTKFVFLRYESIKKNIPEQLGLFPNEKKDSWLRKVKVLLDDLSIIVSSNVTITKSYIIYVDNSQKNCIVEEKMTLLIDCI